MDIVSGNDQQRNTSAQRDPVDWLNLAHAWAEEDARRAGLFAADRAPDEQAAIAEGQRILAQRRQQEQGGPLHTAVPLADATTQHTADVAPIPTPARDKPSAKTFTIGIKIYTRLTAALNKRKLTAAAFLYWILQHRAAQHGEKFTVAELRAYMASLGIHWTDRRIRDALSQGKGLLWTTVHRDHQDRREWVYAMRSKARVMVDCGIVDPGRRVLICDAAWQTGDVRTWRAFVWSAFVDHHPGNGEVSRETLARDFGVSRRASIDLDRRAGTVVKPQVARVLKPHRRNDHEKWLEIANHRTNYAWFAVERWKTHKRSYARVWYCWQDVNRYVTASAWECHVRNQRRKYLMAEVQRLNAENARIQVVDGLPQDQGSSDTTQGVNARRFLTHKRVHDYQNGNPERPVKVFKPVQPHKFNRCRDGDLSWQFEHSQRVETGVLA